MTLMVLVDGMNTQFEVLSAMIALELSNHDSRLCLPQNNYISANVLLSLKPNVPCNS